MSSIINNIFDNLLDLSLNHQDIDNYINLFLNTNNDNINNNINHNYFNINNTNIDNLNVNNIDNYKYLTLFKLTGSDSKNVHDIKECSICLNKFNDIDICMLTKCKHIYHKECIDYWISKNKKTCPLCRKDM